MDPIVATLRRFAVDFFTAHNLSVCAEIITEDYQLTVGRTVIAGRDAQYLPAVDKQLTQFPGLSMTVHGLLATHDRAALHFSEHGASGGPGGPISSWSGVALYHFNGTQLSTCFANEDYTARRRQLKSGLPDAVPSPAAAPWDVVLGIANPEAEAVVRLWLNQPHAASDPHVRYDDEPLVGGSLRFTVTEAEILDLFSSNDRVAYAVVHRGIYSASTDAEALAHDVELYSTGIVTVSGDHVISGQSIRDRQSLLRI